jgi:flagellar protein FlaI
VTSNLKKLIREAVKAYKINDDKSNSSNSPIKPVNKPDDSSVQKTTSQISSSSNKSSGKPSIPPVIKKAAEIGKKEMQKESVEALHENLKSEGVPSELSDEIHKVVHSQPEEQHKREVGGEILNAIKHKQNGDIPGESLTRVVEEALEESKKDNVSKDDIRTIIKEVLSSEMKKEDALKREIAKKLPTTDLSVPMPSVESAEEIRRRYSGGAGGAWQSENLTQINITYPLIVRKGKVHVYANIRFDPATSSLVYKILEPQLSDSDKRILKKIETTLVDELEVDFATLNRQTAEKYLGKKVQAVLDYYAYNLPKRTREVLDYYIYRDFIGLGVIEPLLQDPQLEDISCDGVKVPIYIYHRDPRFGSIKTNISFPDEDSLNSFVMKLAQRSGRSISVADPLLDGALPDGSRVQATFGTGISMKGSNFTIRKFTKDPLTFVDLINYGTVDAEMLAYLWLAIEHQKSVLIAGPTASGKTTMLNALALFIRPELKIVSIEDTPELRLPHENWISQVARMGFGPEGASGKKLGEISLFDLLKASLRQRPDVIVVGEVRGKETYVLFQQMATGHPGLSTIHAESLEGVLNRLRTPPIELPPSLVQHLDILLLIGRQRVKNRYIRRTKEIDEIIGYDVKNDIPKDVVSYTWNPAKDEFIYSGKSAILKEILEITGSTREGIFLEVERRMKVIDWLHQNNIRDYVNVGRIINEYYQDPEGLLERLK